MEKSDIPFTNFIVLESFEKKPITKLSPLVGEKFLLTNVYPKSEKVTNSNILIVKLGIKSHTQSILKMTNFDNIKIKIVALLIPQLLKRNGKIERNCPSALKRIF